MIGKSQRTEKHGNSGSLTKSRTHDRNCSRRVYTVLPSISGTSSLLASPPVTPCLDLRSCGRVLGNVGVLVTEHTEGALGFFFL